MYFVCSSMQLNVKGGLTSAKICRHEPQGEMNESKFEEIAIALNDLRPSETAFTMAVLSAHDERPYEAFSTLHPSKTHAR